MSAYLQDLPLASADKAGGWVGSGFEAQPPQVLFPEVCSPQSISGTERGTLAGRRSWDCFTGVRQVELLGCHSQTETQMWTVPNACPVAAVASTLLSFPGRTVRGQNPEEPSSWPDTAEEAQDRVGLPGTLLRSRSAAGDVAAQQGRKPTCQEASGMGGWAAFVNWNRCVHFWKKENSHHPSCASVVSQ